MSIRSLLTLSLVAVLSFAGCGNRKKCCPAEAPSAIQQELNEFIEMDEAQEIITAENAGKF